MAEQDGTLRLGFIGTGTITSAVVEGFCTSGHPCSILVSPRNEQKARSLEARFSQVHRAASNQEVLNRCEVAVLALRPSAALAGMPSLEEERVESAQEFLQQFGLEVRIGG
jgi:pyrroline-5-carboxylate reductase